jgi:hypothetical protein
LDFFSQIYEFVRLSIEYELCQQILRFCEDAPWPDVIPAKDSLTRLPELSDFLAVKPSSGGQPPSFPEGLFVETLGSVLASLLPLGFGQFVSQRVVRIGSRRGQLYRWVAAKVDEGLRSRFAPAVVKKLKKDIKKEAAKVKKAAVEVAAGRTKVVEPARITVMKLARLAGLPGFRYIDMGLGVARSPSINSPAEISLRRQRYDQVMEKIVSDEALSTAALVEMIGPPVDMDDGERRGLTH